MAQEPLWTCEIDGKARASQQDVLPEASCCKYVNIEDFIGTEDLDQMRSVKQKTLWKKNPKWLSIAKKAKKNTEAFCACHLKKCLFRCPQRSLSFGEVFFGESLPYVQSRVTSLELRCPIRTAFLDISGSMCTSYSTLGEPRESRVREFHIACKSG